MSSNDPIPFVIPDRFIEAVRNGTMRRIGTTVRDVVSGQIRGHLQETQLLQRVLQSCLPTAAGGGKVGILMAAGRIASSLATTNRRLQQIQHALSALQMLTGASLAASVIGIGVSIAGFAMVLRRLELLDQGLADLQRQAVAARLAAEKVGDLIATHDQARTEHLLQRAEEAWLRSDAESVWREVDGPLDQEQRYWRALLGGQVAPSIFHDPRFTLDQAVAAYELVLTLAAVRIQTLLLIEQHAAARHHAEEFHRWHDAVMFAIKPIDVARARSRQEAETTGSSEADARARLLLPSEEFVASVREIQLQVADRPAVIQSIMDRKIRGRAYVEALREREDVPLVVLEEP
jgi:hypothetical protein